MVCSPKSQLHREILLFGEVVRSRPGRSIKSFSANQCEIKRSACFRCEIMVEDVFYVSSAAESWATRLEN